MHTYQFTFFHQSLLDHTTTVTGDTATASTYCPLTSSPPKSLHPSAPPNVSNIIFRVFLISLFATVAIWANHEASKGFSITILNDAGKHSLAGKRFSVFYESNDKATRTILNTSRFLENLLYPNQDVQHSKKQINSVTLRLAPKNFPEIISVNSRKTHEYMITLSPSLMETSYNNDDFVLVVLQGMARVWLYDGEGATPSVLLNGIVEYITALAGFNSTKFHSSIGTEEWNSDNDIIMSPKYNKNIELHTRVWNSVNEHTMFPKNDEICWKDVDPRKVAGFLRFHDQTKQQGGSGRDSDGEVIRRLNNEMRNGWRDSMMDNALGMGGTHACETFDILTRHHYQSNSI